MTTPTRRFLRKHFKAVFKPAARYPADPRAVFMLAFSVFAGITALAVTAGPQTLNSLMPQWAVLLWGALLTTGSATTLIGMARQTDNGILTEQVGSVTVGVTTIFYSVLALFVAGIDALQSIGIILAWGVSCLIRWIQLQALVANAISLGQQRTADIEDGVADFEARDAERRSDGN